jgi:hypothetical protein
MANTARVNGLTPVKDVAKAPVGRVNKYVATDTNALYVGDIVKLDGTTGTGTEAGYRGVTAITATTDIPCGVVVGFLPLLTNLNLPQSYKEANGTDRVVYVCDDPDALFEANASATIAAADVGLNISANVATAGSTTTGQSGHQVDGATEATTATLLFRIVAFKDTPDNDITSASQRVLVKFLRHSYLADAANSAGV